MLVSWRKRLGYAAKRKRKLHIINWVIHFDPEAGFLWWSATWRIWRCDNPKVQSIARGMFWRGFTYPFEIVRPCRQWRFFFLRRWAFEFVLRGNLREWRLGWLRLQEYYIAVSPRNI